MTPEQRAEARRIAREISKVGFVLPGTVTKRYLTCTHQGCKCHGDPPSLHGPYWYWTRKVRAKTVIRTRAGITSAISLRRSLRWVWFQRWD